MKGFRVILIAAAALQLSCLATPINGEAPLDLLVPFNDLLPPLADDSADASSTTSTTTTTTTTTPTTIAPIKKVTTHGPPLLFKSTKKSYYQQQTQHIKELHLIDEDKLVPHDYKEQEEHLQHLHDEPAVSSAPQSKVKLTKQRQSGAQQDAAKIQKKVTKIQYATEQKEAQQSVPQPQYQQFQFISKVQPIPEQRQQAAQRLPPQHVANLPEPPQQAPQHQDVHRFSGHFEQTTRRPTKGGLPTLTPFPRHLK